VALAADLLIYFMRFLQITIPVTDPSLQEILIALLPDLGYEGFEQQQSALQAFLPAESFDAATLETLLLQIPALSTPETPLLYSTVILEERNWNEEWEKSFQPVQVGHFCAVRAIFHPPIPGVTHELIVTPKMSFGTGHHATTYMMLEAMQHLDFQGKQVLDFGTGTGVLAILAEKLGAASILAIDNDDWSIENARENISENTCFSISAEKMDKIPGDRLFDIILANINKHVLLAEMRSIGQQLTIGGVILLSGLLENDFEEIENEAQTNNLSISEKMTKGSWICLKVQKRLK
jgi:ribosomal protein L11 methyltransferase